MARFREALEHKQFELYYQTIVPVTADPQPGRHFELLLRLRDNTGKLIDRVCFCLPLNAITCPLISTAGSLPKPSFAYLKNLPVDFLKIDGIFVKDIVDDPIDYAMVKSINEIGQVMGKRTIAEFVENDAILAKLQKIGVDYAQGYGIALPQPIDQLTGSISNDKLRATQY